MLECPRMCWDMLGCAGMCWGVIECAKIVLDCAIDCDRKCYILWWNVLRLCWNLESAGICWDVLGCARM